MYLIKNSGIILQYKDPNMIKVELHVFIIAKGCIECELLLSN